MKLKWTESQIKYFNKPVLKGQDNDWVMWAILAAISLSGLGYMFLWMII